MVCKIFYLWYSPVVYLKKDVSPTTELFRLVVRIYSSAFKAVYNLYTGLAPTTHLKPLHQISLYFLKISHFSASIACYHYQGILNVTPKRNTDLLCEFFSLFSSLLIKKNFVFAIWSLGSQLCVEMRHIQNLWLESLWKRQKLTDGDEIKRDCRWLERVVSSIDNASEFWEEFKCKGEGTIDKEKDMKGTKLRNIFDCFKNKTIFTFQLCFLEIWNLNENSNW